MATAKVVVSMDSDLLKQIDRLVAQNVFPNRSTAVQEALRDKLVRLQRTRLARECSKLENIVEQAHAEESMACKIREWPDY